MIFRAQLEQSHCTLICIFFWICELELALFQQKLEQNLCSHGGGWEMKKSLCHASRCRAKQSFLIHIIQITSLLFLPSTPFGSNHSGENGVMVCVGKTERDCCAPLPEIDLFWDVCLWLTSSTCSKGVSSHWGSCARAQAAEDTWAFFTASLVIIPKALPGKRSVTHCSGTHPVLCSYSVFVTTLQTAPTPFKPLSSWDWVFGCPFQHEQFISISSMLAHSCNSCKLCSGLLEIKNNQSLSRQELSRGYFLMDLEKYWGLHDLSGLWTAINLPPATQHNHFPVWNA